MTELAVGAALIAAALVVLLRRRRLGYGAKIIVRAAVALASVAAIVMNVGFHLANASPHPWLKRKAPA